MSRTHTVHCCSHCGSCFIRWSGRCPHCGEWNTLIERAERAPQRGQERSQTRSEPRTVVLSALSSTEAEPVTTGLGELDHVLGGGFLPGSVTLIGGEPGIGKSTLLLQVAATLTARGKRVLICTSEESPEQVQRRSTRVAGASSIELLATTRLEDALVGAAAAPYDLVVVDSIQMFGDGSIAASPGSVAQVRACAERLCEYAKTTRTALVLVGHVTKDGTLAGPRLLEHLVDTVVSFEGDRHHQLRTLYVPKHRFGPTGEVGLLEMTGEGLKDVADPSALLLAERNAAVPGGIVVPLLEGRRPMLVEVQALVSSSSYGTPRRAVQGIASGRLALILAVLEERCAVSLSSLDVFSSVAGGVQVSEPATDLGLALALVSARAGKAIADDVVAFGEVGLGGEIRRVPGGEQRLSEARRRGYRRAVVPASTPFDDDDTLVRVGTLNEALEALQLLAS